MFYTMKKLHKENRKYDEYISKDHIASITICISKWKTDWSCHKKLYILWGNIQNDKKNLVCCYIDVKITHNFTQWWLNIINFGRKKTGGKPSRWKQVTCGGHWRKYFASIWWNQLCKILLRTIWGKLGIRKFRREIYNNVIISMYSSCT